MNITHSDLCEAYRAYLRDRIPPSRVHCPPTGELLRFFHPRARRKFRMRIIDHVTKCSFCTREFEIILAIQKKRGELEQEIAECLGFRPNLERSRIDFWKRSFSPTFVRRSATAFIALFVVFAGIFVLSRKGNESGTKPSLKRDSHSIRIQVNEPVSGTHSKARLVFRWEKSDLAESYVLELFNKTLSPVWRSPQIVNNQCEIPEDILKKLPTPETYLWIITATTRSGAELESPLVAFRLRE